MAINDLTFKCILKELVSSVIGNRKAFHTKPKNAPKTISQTSISGVSPTVMPMMTAVTAPLCHKLHPNLLHLLVQEVPTLS